MYVCVCVCVCVCVRVCVCVCVCNIIIYDIIIHVITKVKYVDLLKTCWKLQ